jgi:hypothetical protein
VTVIKIRSHRTKFSNSDSAEQKNVLKKKIQNISKSYKVEIKDLENGKSMGRQYLEYVKEN